MQEKCAKDDRCEGFNFENSLCRYKKNVNRCDNDAARVGVVFGLNRDQGRLTNHAAAIFSTFCHFYFLFSVSTCDASLQRPPRSVRWHHLLHLRARSVISLCLEHPICIHKSGLGMRSRQTPPHQSSAVVDGVVPPSMLHSTPKVKKSTVKPSTCTAKTGCMGETCDAQIEKNPELTCARLEQSYCDCASCLWCV